MCGRLINRKKSIHAYESIVHANAHGTSAGTKDKGGRGDEEESGRCKKKRREKEKEKEERLSSSLKCVGECELVSRESPLSVAPGIPPSVILSARPYFVVHAHAPSIACTHAAVVAGTRVRARASASRISVPPIMPDRANEPRFLTSQSVTHSRRSYIAIYVFVSRALICFTIKRLQVRMPRTLVFFEKQ